MLNSIESLSELALSKSVNLIFSNVFCSWLLMRSLVSDTFILNIQAQKTSGVAIISQHTRENSNEDNFSCTTPKSIHFQEKY